MPDNWVNSIAIDGLGGKWIGTHDGGLAKFDGTTWKVYTLSNSGLPDNCVWSIVIDGLGNKWIVTNNGLAVLKENGVVTSVKEMPNKSIPEKFVYSKIIQIPSTLPQVLCLTFQQNHLRRSKYMTSSEEKWKRS